MFCQRANLQPRLEGCLAGQEVLEGGLERGHLTVQLSHPRGKEIDGICLVPSLPFNELHYYKLFQMLDVSYAVLVNYIARVRCRGY